MKDITSERQSVFSPVIFLSVWTSFSWRGKREVVSFNLCDCDWLHSLSSKSAYFSWGLGLRPEIGYLLLLCSLYPSVKVDQNKSLTTRLVPRKNQSKVRESWLSKDETTIILENWMTFKADASLSSHDDVSWMSDTAFYVFVFQIVSYTKFTPKGEQHVSNLCQHLDQDFQFVTSWNDEESDMSCFSRIEDQFVPWAAAVVMRERETDVKDEISLWLTCLFVLKKKRKKTIERRRQQPNWRFPKFGW